MEWRKNKHYLWHWDLLTGQKMSNVLTVGSFDAAIAVSRREISDSKGSQFVKIFREGKYTTIVSWKGSKKYKRAKEGRQIEENVSTCCLVSDRG
jgi:hypothetical protein